MKYAKCGVIESPYIIPLVGNDAYTQIGAGEVTLPVEGRSLK
jgi:hypothetical protein